MKAVLPNGYRDRPARMEDLDAAVMMFNASARALIGVDKFRPEEQRREWQTPGFDMEGDTRVVLAPDGTIAGYYDVWDIDEPHVRIHCWGRVHPDHSGRGIGSYLLEWAERRARQAIPRAPAEARVAMICHAASINQAAQQLFQEFGMSVTRHSLRMVIEMEEPPPAPQWAESTRVRTLVVGQDEREVVQAVRDSFRDHWGYVDHPFEGDLERWKHYIENSEDFDPSLWFLAMDGGEMAGICLCQPKANDDEAMGWVDTLGVRRPWRRQGLGLALLRHSFVEFYRRRKRKVGLEVDAQSLTGATRLYLKAGMHSDPDRQYTAYEKELRPGKVISTQGLEES